MKKINKLFIWDILVSLVLGLVSCSLLININNAHKIEKKLNSCLNEKSGLEITKESLIVEMDALREEYNTALNRIEELEKENETLKKN